MDEPLCRDQVWTVQGVDVDVLSGAPVDEVAVVAVEGILPVGQAGHDALPDVVDEVLDGDQGFLRPGELGVEAFADDPPRPALAPAVVEQPDEGPAHLRVGERARGRGRPDSGAGILQAIGKVPDGFQQGQQFL
jgi:hypothetical protein